MIPERRRLHCTCVNPRPRLLYDYPRPVRGEICALLRTDNPGFPVESGVEFEQISTGPRFRPVAREMGFCMVLRLGVAESGCRGGNGFGVCGGRTKTQKSYEEGPHKAGRYPTPASGPVGPLATDALRLRPRSSPTGELSGWQPHDPRAQFQSHGHIESCAGEHGRND